jgi:hypothetical protein
MKLFVMLFILTTMLSLMGGCIIRTRSNQRSSYRSCPPAHHWDGYACVHNGRGRRGPPVRDHRR